MDNYDSSILQCGAYAQSLEEFRQKASVVKVGDPGLQEIEYVLRNEQGEEICRQKGIYKSYFYRGLVERWDDSQRRYRHREGFSENSENGAEQQPWMTKKECREEAAKYGAKALFIIESRQAKEIRKGSISMGFKTVDGDLEI